MVSPHCDWSVAIAGADQIQQPRHPHAYLTPAATDTWISLPRCGVWESRSGPTWATKWGNRRKQRQVCFCCIVVWHAFLCWCDRKRHTFAKYSTFRLMSLFLVMSEFISVRQVLTNDFWLRCVPTEPRLMSTDFVCPPVIEAVSCWLFSSAAVPVSVGACPHVLVLAVMYVVCYIHRLCIRVCTCV